MANTAFTVYYIDKGENERGMEQIEKLRKGLRRFVIDNRTEGSNRYPLADLINFFGGDTEGIDNRSTFEVREAEPNTFVCLQTETPYMRDTEFESALQDLFQDVDIIFESECLDDHIWQCNDPEEKYFKGDLYFLDDCENGSEHFDTTEELCEHINDTYGYLDCKTLDDARNYVKHLAEVDGTDIALVVKTFV